MSNDTFYLTFKHRDVFSEVCEKWDEILSDLPWDILFLKVFSVLPNFVFLLFREQPTFTCKAHVFHIDPKTKRSWLPASSAAVNVSFFYDSSRALYRIISVEGTKVRQNTVEHIEKMRFSFRNFQSLLMIGQCALQKEMQWMMTWVCWISLWNTKWHSPDGASGHFSSPFL